MESSLRVNRAALNSKEKTLRATIARLKALQEEMEAKNKDFEIEGAALRAQVQTLQRQLSRSLHEVEELRAKAVAMDKRYKDGFDLWLDSMNDMLAVAPITRAIRVPPRPATA
ncbi:hypothetical protein L914_20906 [Phytophthora nicotianae]|uniref:Autophagy-related protein 16 domain-containing protein n=1 Tax=Phytophthora nicotianae TaxID=4792 RepID=W2M565_PHYNI|nr:hypothetical protein L914_20906 [Phytophthora nicotianae]